MIRFAKQGIFMVIALLTIWMTACQSAAGTQTATDGSDVTAEAEERLCLNGDRRYHIVYDKDAASALKDGYTMLFSAFDRTVSLGDDEAIAVGPYEILLGNTNRPESSALSEGLGQYDYRIAVSGQKVVLTGGSTVALLHAVAHFVRSDVIEVSEDGLYTVPLTYRYDFEGADSREDYINNPDLFLCHWVLDFDVPSWMRDFEEKIAAMQDPDGRMMSTTHRADWIRYPENSIESVISAIQMGVDNLEVDIRLTKDGVPILFHDTTLERMTDWEEKAGKNGLPTSQSVSDWTYEELKQLRLRHNADLYRADGVMTDYIIPTFEEVLIVCNERTTLRLDKTDAWNWDTDIYPLVQKTGSWRTIIPNLEFGTEKQLAILKTIRQDSGMTDIPMWFRFSSHTVSGWVSSAERYQELLGYIPVIRIGLDQKDPQATLASLAANLTAVKDKARIATDLFTTAGGSENIRVWKQLYEGGINWVLVDNGLPFQQYIADNFEPTPH